MKRAKHYSYDSATSSTNENHHYDNALAEVPLKRDEQVFNDVWEGSSLGEEPFCSLPESCMLQCDIPVTT